MNTSSVTPVKVPTEQVFHSEALLQNLKQPGAAI